MQTIHIQGAGQVPAKPAAEVKPGDVLLFNQGGRYDVLSAERSGGWVSLEIRDREKGAVYTLRKRAATLMGVR